MKQREGLVMLINVLVCTYVRPFETAFFFSSFSLGKSDTCVFYGPYTRLFFFFLLANCRENSHTHTQFSTILEEGNAAGLSIGAVYRAKQLLPRAAALSQHEGEARGTGP